MKKLILITFSLIISNVAFAKKDCTDQPKAKWMSEDAFKKMALTQGYTITKFKQPGNCYEIYGKNKEGKKVEVYFNPVDGSVVKSEIDE